ncbi:MAG: DUF6879 family protein [Streptosporangiaceae bacterium]
MTAKVPPFSELIAATSASAVHLETRDAYTPSDPSFLAWQGGPPFDRTEREQSWRRLVGGAVARGVSFRRARIVSEPVTPYIRFEYDVTEQTNLAAGEQVRWLPRRRASDLCLPGNDFWLLDSRLVLFANFAGNGDFLDDEMSEDPVVARRCASAFEAVWERATDHEKYRPA